MNMRFFKHLGKLLGEFVEFAWENKAWWILPIVLVLLLVVLIATAGQTITPWIYPFF